MFFHRATAQECTMIKYQVCCKNVTLLVGLRYPIEEWLCYKNKASLFPPSVSLNISALRGSKQPKVIWEVALVGVLRGGALSRVFIHHLCYFCRYTRCSPIRKKECRLRTPVRLQLSLARFHTLSKYTVNKLRDYVGQ